MRNSKKTTALNCVCVFLVLLSWLTRFLLRDNTEFTCNVLIYTFFTAAALIWASQLHRCLTQPEIRKNLIAVELQCIAACSRIAGQCISLTGRIKYTKQSELCK